MSKSKPRLLRPAEAARQEGPADLSVCPDIGQADVDIFERVTATELDDEQVRRVREPETVLPRQKAVLAVHWHPEFVPQEHIRARLAAMFPKCRHELIIPTQHNVLLDWDGHSGVEVDCYASGFNQKVQLLLHFQSDRVREAPVLRAMLEHTLRYRSSQLFEFMRALTCMEEACIGDAVRATAADEALVRFVAAWVEKIRSMLEARLDTLSPETIKNKILRNYFDELRPVYGEVTIGRAQAYMRAVKAEVKRHFPLTYFYRASEVIEETRALGGGVVIPHPEQFWPILLAGYDVDGYEVWNPQSRRYTDFLISVVNEMNTRERYRERPILIFMGDDCHMGEKVKNPAMQDPEKAGREIGFQPAWDDLEIRKKLVLAGMNRRRVIDEYRARLAS